MSKALKEKNPTACNGKIVIPWKRQQHIYSAHPDVVPVLAEAIGLVTLPTNDSELSMTVELGRPVGRSGIIVTRRVGYGEVTTFAVRNGRDRPSRVVCGEQSPEVSTVGIFAIPARSKGPEREILPGKYMLVSAWIGRAGGDSVPEPWDPQCVEDAELRACALKHWSTIAFEYDAHIMGPVFETSWKSILEDEQ